MLSVPMWLVPIGCDADLWGMGMETAAAVPALSTQSQITVYFSICLFSPYINLYLVLFYVHSLIVSEWLKKIILFLVSYLT